MKIAIAQLNYKIGDFAGNARKITECIERAQIPRAAPSDRPDRLAAS